MRPEAPTAAIVYFDGRLAPADQAVVPVYDAGFMQGTTVAEQLRTFGGRLYQLEAHLRRLEQSLAIVGVDPEVSLARLGEIAVDVAAHNHALGDADDDLALCMFVTPGPYGPMAGGYEQRPLVCIHTYKLPFRLWAHKYAAGQALATTSVAQVPHDCWPPQLKCRSRMHYYLADRDAGQRFAGSRALLRDDNGFVTEATTANVLIYRHGAGLLTPPRAKVLPGISLAAVVELAARLKLPLAEADLTADDLAAADEVLLCSTSPCLLPVVTFNGQPIADGRSGAVFAQLLAAWSESVGLNIAAQAVKFAARD